MGQSQARRCAAGLLLLAMAGLAAAQEAPPPPPPPNQGYFGAGSFTPSMAIVIVVLISAFFFLGFFSIYIRQCGGDRLGGADYTSRGGLAGLASASRSRRPRGIDAAVLETFPTMAYADVKAHKAGKGALECAVCLSEFDDDETLRLLPKCSHVFHPDCIDAWLATHVTCPVCRANLVPDPNAPPQAELEIPAPPQPAQAPAAPQQAAVAIDVEESEEERARREEAADLERIGSLKRALRSKSGRRPAPFPRSHSTGHSLAAPRGDAAAAERFTLRLPEHVLREIVAAGELQRAASLRAFRLGGEGSARRGYRGGAEGSSRGGRSVRLGRSDRRPSFLARTFSARFPAWGSVWKGDVDGSSKGGKVGFAAAAAAAAGGGKGGECDDQTLAHVSRV